ncbi:MAG: alanine racemase [Gammaproteobacteria bacterium]|nr:alanine racemase [Gammaproteobacteria bacterium]MDE0444489.1 alanine racemase [Gammaproteobacteria bacterium]
MSDRIRSDDSDPGLARLTVDLGALRENYRRVADVGSRTAAVVKADAYGLGAVRVVEALCREGCRDFFVATESEGIAVRAGTRDSNIFVFSGPPNDRSAAAMVRHALTPVLNDEKQLQRWREHRETPVAVHVDTGMHRLGFDHAAVSRAMFDGFNVAVVLSHLACADDPAHPMNNLQADRFEAIRPLFPNALGSLANSAGALTGIESDMARAGIALYGGNPFSTRPNPMLPVATLEALVVALRTVPKGQPIGYGGTYTTPQATRIAVLGAGYADGIPRGLSPDARVAFRSHRLPVVGRVSMDLLHVDASGVEAGIALGDWVEVFGHTVGIDETAAWAGTISYELLTRLGSRVQRFYTGQ